MSPPPFDERTVLITGGAARVGKAIAEHLAGRGADLAIHYRTSEESARSMRRDFRDRGIDCEILRADLAEFDEVDELVARAERAVGPLDALINNAAIWRRTPFRQATVDDWEQLVDVNLKAPFFLARNFARKAGDRPGAAIVNLVDVFARRPLVEYSAYGTTKAGLHYLTEVLAAELAPDIRVNGVAPGTVLLNEDHDADRADELDEAIPMGLTGSPQDIAETVEFLLDGPDYVTGEIIAVDGARRHVST